MVMCSMYSRDFWGRVLVGWLVWVDGRGSWDR